MSQGVMRTRKDGGCSICKASPENVGKRRCNHVMDDAEIKVKKEGNINFINISGKVDGKNTKFNIEASNEKIKDYISNLSKGLSKKEKQSILNTLHNM